MRFSPPPASWTSSSTGRLRGALGTGTRLDDSWSRLLSEYFGSDLSTLTVHVGAESDRLVQEAGALAFTVGQDVFFRHDAWAPDTTEGLRLLFHEATHVAQQVSGIAYGDGPEPSFGPADHDDETVADACADDLLALVECAAADPRAGRTRVPPRRGSRRTQHGGLVLHRAIGLEVEVAVPIDKLTPAEVAQIRTRVAQEHVAGMAQKPGHRVAAVGMRDMLGAVTYGEIRNAAGGFRVDADHDDRVTPPNPLTTGWPIRQGSRDSIIEIVMEPPAVGQAALTTAMTNITAFVAQIDAQTNQLTTRWVDAFPALGAPAMPLPVSVGPFDYTNTGAIPPVRLPQHNYQGSIQVNIGIDLREYHSLLKWYVDSDYATAARMPDPASQAIYRDIKAHIREAVEIGRAMTDQIHAAAGAPQRQQAGNFRGLRGWLTHLALYLRRGTLPLASLSGSVKNLAPVLAKSPNQVLATYGMTPAEQNHFTANRNALMNQLFQATGRPGDVGRPLPAVDVFAAAPGGTDADALSDLTAGAAGVALTGKPIPQPTGVGRLRTGNAHVQALPSVPGGNVGGGANTRGGFVAEFRALPGYYDGPAQWATVAQAFFDAAETRNARDGVQPD